jgi:hypothetical protein
LIITIDEAREVMERFEAACIEARRKAQAAG